MMLKEKIIEHHGRIEDIILYDSMPSKDDLDALKKKALNKSKSV